MHWLQLYLCILRDGFYLKLTFLLEQAIPANNRLRLPWFILAAAEDEGRTELPTERRRQKEREEGRVPKSAEIPAALVTLGGLMIIFFMADSMMGRLATLLKQFVGNFYSLPTANLDKQAVISILGDAGMHMVYILAPIMILAFLLGLLGNLVQVGFLFSLKPLQPDLNRIKFTFQNLAKRVFFSRQVFVNLLKAIAKVGLLTVVSYYLIGIDFENIMKSGEVSVGAALKDLSIASFRLALVLTILLLILAIPDYIYQRIEFTESIKMKREDVKQEQKETEGDPLVKQRQRQRAQELMRRNIMGAIKQADVVITNPTHFAVALRYDPAQEHAPKVLVKGEDNIALIIKNLARQSEVPIVENKPLARALYANVEENQIVPPEFYTVLVEIFSVLMQSGKIKERKAS